MELLTNISQLLLYLLIVFAVYRLKVIPSWIALYLVLFSTSPFWFNGLLFPSEYMPDQFRYLSSVMSFREFNIITEDTQTIYITGFLLSLIPIPFIFNVIGVAFINKIIFLILFLWLYRKRFLYGYSLYFVLLYPDLILYTSLCLRDNLIMILMIIGTIFLIQRNYILLILFFIPLLFIKFQNFALMMILSAMYLVFMRDKFIYSKYTKFYFNMMIFMVVGVSFLILPYVIEPIEFYRRAMFIEDGGIIDNYIPLSSLSDLFILGLKSPLYFLLKPFFFEATNTFQYVQSFFNILIFIFLVWFTFKSYKINKFKTLFWLLFLLFSMMIYGLVVSNFGTAARYRFPFIVLYVIALHIDICSKGYRNVQ